MLPLHSHKRSNPMGGRISAKSRPSCSREVSSFPANALALTLARDQRH